VRRPVRLGNGQTLWMAGVANVATLPDYRGRGYASQLLADLHAVMDSEDFAFGLLFTGIHDFYERHGWERLPLPLYEATPAPVDIAGWRFRTAAPDDLPAIQRWYAAFYADHPLTVQRDDAYWRLWTRWEDPKWRNKFYLAEDARGTARGYLALETHYETDAQGNRAVSAISVGELGCAPDDTAATRMLIGFASQTALAANASLHLFLPETDIERFVRPLLPDVHWIGNHGAMVRVSNWEIFYEADIAQRGVSMSQSVALALLLGLPAPENTPLSPELRRRYPVRPACYSPVDSF
ncbi:MAG: GNAT family N-acetyltransferase, partial [Fimbriimonadales bacterium]